MACGQPNCGGQATIQAQPIGDGKVHWNLMPNLRRSDTGKVSLEVVKARLEICEPCPRRQGNGCLDGRDLDMRADGAPGQAQYKHEECPRHIWPGERPDCVELGDAFTVPELERMGIDPPTCGCAGKIRRCGLHGQCTTAIPRDGMSCCASCDDRIDK